MKQKQTRDQKMSSDELQFKQTDLPGPSSACKPTSPCHSQRSAHRRNKHKRARCASPLPRTTGRARQSLPARKQQDAAGGGLAGLGLCLRGSHACRHLTGWAPANSLPPPPPRGPVSWDPVSWIWMLRSFKVLETHNCQQKWNISTTADKEMFVEEI